MRTLYHITIRELKRIIRLPAHYIVLLAMPPCSSFACAISTMSSKPITCPWPYGMRTNPAVSRQFTFLLQQAATLRFTKEIGNIGELQDLIQKGEIMGAIHFQTHGTKY